MPGAEKPFPPGDYPVVVVGSGPGGLQLSYSLSRLGIRHALLSAEPAAGGMFRKWPLFQRLLSWTKPYAPDGPGSRRYERTDWNSLLADEAEAQALQAQHMDGSSHFPSRAEMEANLADFAERTGIVARYGCEWQATAHVDDETDMRFALTTSDGEYRCQVAVLAVGVAEPWIPAIPGIELGNHYADVRPAESYAGRRVFIIGKGNSGFEIASGLLQWARTITLASPSHAKMSVMVNSLVGVRARYLQPFEDHALGGGCVILDASIEEISRTEGPLTVHLRRKDDAHAFSIEVDDVINTTGFVCPLRDLPAIGVATFGQSRLPAQTAWWESATVPGIFFAGTITQGAPSLAKYGTPPNSGAVHGHRYNARILARRIAVTEFGVPAICPNIPPERLVDRLLDEAANGPELWHQRGYLARLISVTAEDGVRDCGVAPLTTFLDEDGGDGVALTIEADGTGAIFPVAYIRTSGRIEEHLLPPSDLADLDMREQRKVLTSALANLVS